MIAIVTDSASMLSPAWRDRFGVHVAPMTVLIDGTPYREGVEITTAEFYRRLAGGAEVSTSTPSPGDLLATYLEAVGAGATGIVSIHTGSDYSAVLDAARIAAREVSIDVELVNTATTSFPVALCVAAACDARAAGGDLEVLEAAASSTAAVVDSIFVVGVRGGLADIHPHVGTRRSRPTRHRHRHRRRHRPHGRPRPRRDIGSVAAGRRR
ncbi:MAG: DegV family EDD domain-containing protein [Acidimicrobiia bacterium]|nr:DegV family EDD domain-containing protein [Acidimicrobiia bacterium]